LKSSEKKLPKFIRNENELKPPGSPFRLPLSAWWRVIRRTATKFGTDNLTVIAGGCAFFTLTAIVPALTAIILLYGLIADPHDINTLLNWGTAILPPEAAAILTDTVTRLAESGRPALGLSFFIALVIAMWSSTKTVRAITSALNVVYNEREKRGFFRLNLHILMTTLAGIFGFMIIQFLITGLPTILALTGLGPALDLLLGTLRWPILLTLACIGMMLIYRLGPSRRNAKLIWGLPGALLASLLWLMASGAFSVYILRFGNYDTVYGPFGAMVILLLWLYWSYLILLLGGELNSELEREVIGDTTTGAPRPLGDRGAIAADTVALRPDISKPDSK
jgi:membrane protein